MEMLPSNFSQISDVIYNQQPLPPQTSQPAPKLEPVKEEDPTGGSWEEYLKATGPAGDRVPSDQFPTHDVEAENEQLQLAQQRPFSHNAINTEHEHTAQNQSLVTSRDKQDNNAVLDQGFIDPRMFSANYDPRTLTKKSP